MVTDTLIDSFPVSQYDASVAEVLKEIGEYQSLKADWNSEGALAVSPEAAHLAAWLVQMVALSARHQGVSWQPPVVGPSADGGINLEWDGADRQLLVMVRPGQQIRSAYRPVTHGLHGVPVTSRSQAPKTRQFQAV